MPRAAPVTIATLPKSRPPEFPTFTPAVVISGPAFRGGQLVLSLSVRKTPGAIPKPRHPDTGLPCCSNAQRVAQGLDLARIG